MRQHIKRTLPVVVGVVVLAAGASVLPAFAKGHADASDSPTISAGQVIDGAAYLAGNTVNVAGTVKGDLFCAGNSVTITGVVEGDILCGGNTVTVVGQVGGDVRLAGNTVSVTGKIQGSATIGGNAVATVSGSTIGQDLTVGASSLNLAGDVGRDVLVGAQTAVFAGAVGRDVDGQLGDVTVTPTAVIGGHLQYVSSRDATVAPGAVKGDVTRTEPPADTRMPSRGPSTGQMALMALMSVVGFVVLSLFVALVLPRYVRSSTEMTWQGFFKAFLVGLLAVIAVLPASVLLLLSVAGIQAALLLLVAAGLMTMLAGPLTAYFVGKQILRGRVANVLGIMAVGAALLGVLGVIPIVGFLVVAVAGCAGVGMMVLGLRTQFGADAYVEPHLAS